MRVYSFGACDGFPDVLEAPAFLIEDGDQLILVDCPPQINLMLKQIGVSVMDLTGIVITHLHNDHVGGLIDLIKLRMICLSKPEIMREAGYFTRIAREKLTIAVHGLETAWFKTLHVLIGNNCPPTWLPWQVYHLFEEIKSNCEFCFGDTKFEPRKTLHDVSAVGLRINGRVGISGDTPYDAEYFDWLIQGSEFVFHEFGYAGSHTLESDIPKVVSAHPKIKLYHMPYPVKKMMNVQGFSIAERCWYEL